MSKKVPHCRVRIKRRDQLAGSQSRRHVDAPGPGVASLGQHVQDDRRPRLALGWRIPLHDVVGLLHDFDRLLEAIVDLALAVGAGDRVITVSQAGCAVPCLADINGDAIVDANDLGAILATWGVSSDPNIAGDLTGDGQVDGQDLGSLFASWGPCS